MRSFYSLVIATAAGFALSACEPTVPEAPDAPPAFVGEGMPEAEAEALVGQIFAQNGCSMSISDYAEALDVAGYDPEMHDIATPEGHRAMIDRFILEATPMDLAKTDAFSRRGSKLTSHIGDCA